MQEKSKQDRPQISHLRKLAHYVRPYFPQLALAVAALLLTSASVLAIPAGFRYIVDEGLSKGNEQLLDCGLLVLLASVLVLACATFCRFYFMNWAGERIVADIRRDVYAHIIRLSPEFYEQNRSGDLISRLTQDIAVVQLVISSQVAIALRNTLTLLGGLVMLYVTSPKLTLYILAIVPLVVFPILFLGRRVRGLSKLNQERLSDMAAHIEENIYGIKTVQTFVREENEIAKFGALTQQSLAAARKRIFMRASLTALVIMLIFSAIAFVLWTGGRDVVAHKISPGDLTAFLLYSVFVASSVGAISEVIGDLQRAGGAADRLMQLMQVDSGIQNPAAPKHLNVPAKGTVEFVDVNFSYPSDAKNTALKNFSLKISPGEKVAIVGPSGAGKSTVFELLLRFYDVQAGAVKIDGIDIRELALDELRHHIGIVSQSPVVFSTTAAENIALGGEGDVEAAAKSAQALEFINKLPNGFNTYLGEKGVRLSGGQKQRLAIARVILKNPEILLLDEATSALDSENERLVQEAIENLAKDRTTIIIAHRLSTIKSVNRIVVLNHGQIEAVGTHKQLLASSKLYKNLAELQFRD